MKCKINRDLLSIKLHYFLFWGGLSGVMPFLLLIAKELGISATAAAVFTSVYPIVPLIAKPVFGTLADYFKRPKLMVILTLIFTNIFILGIIFIPPITSTENQTSSLLLCSSQGFEIALTHENSDKCLPDLNNISKINLTGRCYSCDQPLNYLQADYSNLTSADLICSENVVQAEFVLNQPSKHSTNNIWFPVNDVDVSNDTNFCNDLQFYSCYLNTDLKTSCHSEDKSFVYFTYQFWLFVVFYVCSRTGMSVIISLSDTICFEMLKGRFHLYGKQRMWGAMGWGVLSLIAGYLLTFTTHNDFSPSLYMAIGLLLVDAITVSRISVEVPKVSGRIMKDLRKLLKNIKVFVFLCNVFIMGFLTGINWNYLFWFLYTIGASKLLLSCVLVVQCFLGELPSFFFSGKLIEKIGFQNAFSLSFLAFGVRFLSYSFVTYPWYVLPVELCQGLTFGIFYSAMAMYAKSVALPGTEGSMQGLVGGTFEGLGVAVGGLIAGVTLDLVGGHQMFRYASIVAFGSAILHFCTHLFFKHFFKTSGKDDCPTQDNGEESML